MLRQPILVVTRVPTSRHALLAVFFVVLFENLRLAWTDARTQDCSWKRANPFESCFTFAERWVKRAMRKPPDTTCLMTDDHNFGPKALLRQNAARNVVH